jgi:hypothetical protein
MESDQILLLLSSDPWKNAPAERDAPYFRTWQRTSIALQKALRRWIPELYFRDTARFEDRDTAYQLIVYAACRPCYGQPKTEFTFDMADPGALRAAMRSIGHSTQLALAPFEPRLRSEGRADLAIRYMPVWYQDILLAVKKKPKLLIRLLADESKLVNAVIDLGTSRDAASANRLLRTANAALRSIVGHDMRQLIPHVLEEATRVLAEKNRAPGGVDDLIDGGAFDDDHARAAGSPDGRIRSEEDCDHGRTDRGGKVSDARIVADVHTDTREPDRKFVQVGDANRLIQYFLGAGAPSDGHFKA